MHPAERAKRLLSCVARARMKRRHRQHSSEGAKMVNAQGWKGPHHERRKPRLLQLVIVAAMTAMACEPHTVTAPIAVVPASVRPASDMTSSDGYAQPCFANSRACGEFFASVG